MSYRPREFWERRLSEHFDLRGTGETGLSLAYNEACYTLRREVLERALREADVPLAGAKVLDVGCGTGFFMAFYVARGAEVTGLDLTAASVDRLAAAFPAARFVLADVSDGVPEGPYAVVNAFDVLYHITDDARWEQAVRNLARVVSPNGILLVTDLFSTLGTLADHNVVRTLARYRAVLESEGLSIVALHPTHVLLNRELGPFRPLNRLPSLLLRLDRALLRMGLGQGASHNKLMIARARR